MTGVLNNQPYSLWEQTKETTQKQAQAVVGTAKKERVSPVTRRVLRNSKSRKEQSVKSKAELNPTQG
jgi:hypothetical protein